MKPYRATVRSLQRCAVGFTLVLAAFATTSEQEQAFLCTEWQRGTKNVDQLKATYSIATGKPLTLRSGEPRTGVRYIDGDLKQLADEVDTACAVESIGFR